MDKNKNLQKGTPIVLHQKDDQPKTPPFPQFLVMSSTQSGKTTASLSPLLLRKGIQGIAGDVTSVKPLGSGDLLIEVFRRQQAINLMSTTSFGGISVEVKAHSSLNCSKGVIRCPALRNDTDAAILAYFDEENIPVSEVRRILTRKNTEMVPTDTFILTYSIPVLPSTVTIGYQRYNISVYIPNPLRCRNCQKYGHHEKRCRRKMVCQYCGREGHDDKEECDIAGVRCVNCEGKHAASSRDCPTWTREREILRVKYTQNVSFPEARRIVESRDRDGPSYSQVTKARSSVGSVTVSDASVQASEDIPAFGSKVPVMAGQQNLKVLTGNASRFKPGKTSLLNKQDTTKPKPQPPVKSSSSNKPTKPPTSSNKQTKPPTSSKKPSPPSNKPSSSSNEVPSSTGKEHSPRPIQRSHSLSSVSRSLEPRSQDESLPEGETRPKKKIKISRQNNKPDLHPPDFSKGSNRYNALLDLEDQMETTEAHLRTPTPPKSGQGGNK